jgi:glycerol-3-phosphate dehydrogenase
VVHVTGGKLTTYREMAAQVVDMVAGPEALAERTAAVPLPGGDRSVDQLLAESAEVIAEDAVRHHLVLSYGSRWRDVWSLGDDRPELRERLAPPHAVIGAEMVHGVQHEMAMTLGDLLIRRTHLAFAMPDQARSIAPSVAEIIAPVRQFTSGGRDDALREYDREIDSIFG